MNSIYQSHQQSTSFQLKKIITNIRESISCRNKKFMNSIAFILILFSLKWRFHLIRGLIYSVINFLCPTAIKMIKEILKSTNILIIQRNQNFFLNLRILYTSKLFKLLNFELIKSLNFSIFEKLLEQLELLNYNLKLTKLLEYHELIQ